MTIREGCINELPREDIQCQTIRWKPWESTRKVNKWGLTPSQREIGELLCRGLTIDQTAAKLGKSPRTVRNTLYGNYDEEPETPGKAGIFGVINMVYHPQKKLRLKDLRTTYRYLFFEDEDWQ